MQELQLTAFSHPLSGSMVAQPQSAPQGSSGRTSFPEFWRFLQELPLAVCAYVRKIETLVPKFDIGDERQAGKHDERRY